MSIFVDGDSIYIHSGTTNALEVSQNDLARLKQEAVHVYIASAIEHYIEGLESSDRAYYAEMLFEDKLHEEVINTAEKNLNEFLDVNIQMIIKDSINHVIAEDKKNEVV